MHYPLSLSLSLSLPLESSSRRLKENSVDCRPCARLNFTPNANIGGHRSFCIMPFLPSLRSSYTRSDSRPRIAITHPHGCRIPFQPTTYDRSQLPWLTPKNPWNRVFTSKGESSIPPLRLRLACARRTPTVILLTTRIPIKFSTDPNYRGNVGNITLRWSRLRKFHRKSVK